jgi:hypothetical protein
MNTGQTKNFKVYYGNAFQPLPHKIDGWPKCLDQASMWGTVDEVNNVIFILGVSTSDVPPTGS